MNLPLELLHKILDYVVRGPKDLIKVSKDVACMRGMRIFFIVTFLRVLLNRLQHAPLCINHGHMVQQVL